MGVMQRSAVGYRTCHSFGLPATRQQEFVLPGSARGFLLSRGNSFGPLGRNIQFEDYI